MMLQLLGQSFSRRSLLSQTKQLRFISSQSSKGLSSNHSNFNGAKKYGYRPYSTARFSANKGATSLMILGGSAFVASCLYGLSHQDQNVLKQELKRNIKTAYAWLFGSLCFTYACARAFIPIAMRVNPLLSLIPMFGVSFFGAPLVRSISYDQNPLAKTVGFGLICAAIGFMLSYTLAFFPSAIITQASICSGSLFSGLCAAGMSAPTGKFDNMASFCSVGILIIFVASIASIFAPPHVTAFQNLFVYMGIPAISGLTLYSSNQLYDEARKSSYMGQTFDPVNCAIPLYFNIINLFNMFVTLFNKERKK